MSNYRKYRKSFGDGQGSRKSVPVSRWIMLAIVVIVLGLLARMALTRDSSKAPENKNADDIQSLESLLKDVNVNINGVTNSQNSNTSVAAQNKTTCDRAYSAINTADKVIALTFNSSSVVTYAQHTIDELKNSGVPATFFLTGSFATSQAALTKAISDAGFAIANNSDTYPDFSTLNAEGIGKEVTGAKSRIAASSGKDPIGFFRPPGGYLGSNSAVASEVLKSSNCTVTWTIDGMDWKKETTKDDVINSVKAGLTPGAIIMLQLGNDASDGALPTIIADAKQAGYQFVSLTDYFSPPQP